MGSATQQAGVWSTIEYVTPESELNLRYSGYGGEENTGTYARQKVFIADARRAGAFNLQNSGFELVRQKSEADFYDPKSVEAVYHPEVERLLTQMTGADKVVLLGGLRRHAAAPHGMVFGAAGEAHVDYSALESGRIARRLLGLERDAPLPYRRYMAINLWRALSKPPQDRPLAVCHALSVATQAGMPNYMIRVDQLPPREQMAKELPANYADLPQGWIFLWDPAHRWYYYPNMAADELLLFKLYDSEESGAWRCPHSAFLDPSAPADAPPRESYEMRSFVYFN